MSPFVTVIVFAVGKSPDLKVPVAPVVAVLALIVTAPVALDTVMLLPATILVTPVLFSVNVPAPMVVESPLEVP